VRHGSVTISAPARARRNDAATLQQQERHRLRAASRGEGTPSVRTCSLISDADLKLAGAEILERASDVWATADLLLKVKEPLETEYPLLREGQVLFTYLHLAASKPCTDALLASRTTAVAYETVGSPDRTFPLLAPMSEVAGRLAPQVGAYHMMRALGGRGILPGGVPGTRPA
jgi:alanine dehydrogenase